MVDIDVLSSHLIEGVEEAGAQFQSLQSGAKTRHQYRPYLQDEGTQAVRRLFSAQLTRDAGSESGEPRPECDRSGKYNQYRTGVGHYNVTSVLDMRRIEVGLRFKF